MGGNGPSEPIEAECPTCGYLNEFSLNPDYADFKRDAHGYCLDVFGSPLMSEHGPVSSHYGRRCFGYVPMGKEFVRCEYRWTFKICEACSSENDIAARYCSTCKAELIDPAAKLVAEFVAQKKDPSTPSTDRVLSYETRESVSQKGNRTLRVDFVTEFRQFSVWLMPEPTNSKAAADWARWEACDGDIRTVSYVREPSSQFWRILAFNKPADDEELPGMLADDPKIARLRKSEPSSSVCLQCGGPMSKYSSGVCRDCYTTDHKPKIKTCGICGQHTDHRADNHQACLDEQKAGKFAA